MKVEAILCHIKDKDRLLLQYKAKGKFGEGKWNGPGGKILKGETKEQAVEREVLEETGLLVSDLKYVGKTTFIFPKKGADVWIVYIFLTENFSGELKHSEEGKLQWLKIKNLPYKNMWPDDIYWMPVMLKGKIFDFTFWLDEKGKKVLKYQNKQVVQV
jgi:8-oxo-dGTP diphosphatase